MKIYLISDDLLSRACNAVEETSNRKLPFFEKKITIDKELIQAAMEILNSEPSKQLPLNHKSDIRENMRDGLDFRIKDYFNIDLRTANIITDILQQAGIAQKNVINGILHAQLNKNWTFPIDTDSAYKIIDASNLLDQTNYNKLIESIKVFEYWLRNNPSDPGTLRQLDKAKKIKEMYDATKQFSSDTLKNQNITQSPIKNQNNIPDADDFRKTLIYLFDKSLQQQKKYVDINSGDLHRQIGGYPGTNHRMPVCCDVMYQMMQKTDTIMSAPLKGKGASLTIRYTLPRDNIETNHREKLSQVIEISNPSHTPKIIPSIVHEPLHPTVLRQYEFFGGDIRLKISVKNESPSAILDVMLDLENDENILSFDRYEPETYTIKSGKIMLGNILPKTDRTISYYLEPLICAKEGTDVNCFVRYKDASGVSHNFKMEPLKISVICPIFNTENPVNIGQIKILVASLRSQHNKIYTFPTRIDAIEVLDTCKQVVHLHDIWHISTLKKENLFESWFYGKTKVSKKDLIIKTYIDKNKNYLEITVYGDDQKDVTGLLAELNRNLVEEFKKIGKLQTVNNITIIDSLLQHSRILDYCNTDGLCDVNITIQDSVVQRSNFLSPNQGNTND